MPASVLNRRSNSFRQPYDSTVSILSQKQQQQRTININNNRTKLNNHHQSSLKVAPNHTGFKLVDILNSQKNKITSIDMHTNFNNPALNQLNATIKKICRSNTTPSQRVSDNRTASYDRRKFNPFDSYGYNGNEYHDVQGINHLMPMTVPELSNNVGPRSNNKTILVPDIRSVHASTCTLAAPCRTSNQSIAGTNGRGARGDDGFKHELGCSNSAINLKYGSLRSYKGRTKRSNSEQLNPSYYHFQNIDGDFGELDNNNAFDSVLLPPQSSDNHKLPWKHRQCPSITSSNSGTSITSIKTLYIFSLLDFFAFGFCFSIHSFHYILIIFGRFMIIRKEKAQK